MKPNKENILIDILIELEKGTAYKECLSVIVGKYPMTERTFTRYWTKGQQRHAIKQRDAQSKLNEVYIDNLENTLKTAILTKNEALEILTKIAKAEPEDGKLTPKVIEQIQAIKTAADLQGWNSPIKTDITTDNAPLKALSYSELLQIAHGVTGTNN
jgi:hypothetical protein